MTDILGQLTNLQRPSLLVRAARIAATHYRREHHLRSILGSSHLPRHAVALLRLTEIESEMNARREIRNANYSVTRHIDVLTAIVVEARLFRSAPDDDSRNGTQVNASASASLRCITNASRASEIAGSSAGC